MRGVAERRRSKPGRVSRGRRRERRRRAVLCASAVENSRRRPYQPAAARLSLTGETLASASRCGAPVHLRFAIRVGSASETQSARSPGRRAKTSGDVGRSQHPGRRPRAEEDRSPRKQPAGLRDRTRVRTRSDDGADARHPTLADERLAPPSRTSCATWCQGGLPSDQAEVEDVPAAPVLDVRTRKKTPAPSRRHAARKGSTESRPDVGARGHARPRAARRRRRLEVRRAYARDVEPMSPRLGRQDEQPGGARVGADLLERAHAVRAERLEESGLRLDRDDIAADSVDDPLAEARDRRGGRSSAEHGLAAQPVGSEIEQRVETDDELTALAGDDLDEAIGEGDCLNAHRREARRRRRTRDHCRIKARPVPIVFVALALVLVQGATATDEPGAGLPRIRSQR